MESHKSCSGHPLEVKKGTLVRTLKDYEAYKVEVSEAKSKLESLRDTEDKHEFRKAKEILDEATAVLEFTRKRLAGYATDLDVYIRDSILPLLDTPNVPPMCKVYVKEAREHLDRLVTNHPEVEFKFATEAS
ncbi:uncharacterized protein TOT_040000308 [Theileria orientalis strain Shintoku]|uniref:Tubulin-specific chaperone A n=1 Tax=Theileria orientalis strain Shintoku TaxID=869250 RepID=J4C951_THEOR|nr:uncharacterized protein TOT_040000308 [Theileria orientalis strain Shintoku]PVC51361.1 hypothetical protein MACL_00001622 [Theileria orientalis]BAM41928.1 uncharacterized protein TOT_040000308 [Theileria orientalis strain Shintoku]|eukprot:XP_009692229.1 uncharacterized protein TOT_040000308 [Theileria orientalis strain Shintoku]